MKIAYTRGQDTAILKTSNNKTSLSESKSSRFSVEVLNGRSLGDTIIFSVTDQFNRAQRVLITQ
jgi:hypothetical protein